MWNDLWNRFKIFSIPCTHKLGTERVDFEPTVGSQAVPKLALAGATREKTIQEVDGLFPGPAGLLRLATITPRPQF